MDCVGCEKCRLWGKIQTTGLGTALKILFADDTSVDKYRLTRTELVALINTYHRVSTAIKSLGMFQIETARRTVESELRKINELRKENWEKMMQYLAFASVTIASCIILFIAILKPVGKHRLTVRKDLD